MKIIYKLNKIIKIEKRIQEKIIIEIKEDLMRMKRMKGKKRIILKKNIIIISFLILKILIIIEIYLRIIGKEIIVKVERFYQTNIIIIKILKHYIKEI